MGLDTIVDDTDVIRPINKIMIKMTSCKPTLLRHHDHFTRSLDLLMHLITNSNLPDVTYMQCLVFLCRIYPAIRNWDPHEGLHWVALAKYHTIIARGLISVAEHRLNEMERDARDAYDEIVQSGANQEDGGSPVGWKAF